MTIILDLEFRKRPLEDTIPPHCCYLWWLIKRVGTYIRRAYHTSSSHACAPGTATRPVPPLRVMISTLHAVPVYCTEQNGWSGNAVTLFRRYVVRIPTETPTITNEVFMVSPSFCWRILWEYLAVSYAASFRIPSDSSFRIFIPSDGMSSELK
jgi:hypothetical protein